MKAAIIVGLLTLPTTLYAAGLIPCGGPGEEECQACHLVALGQNILNFLIIIAIALAVVLVAIAGFRMVIAGSNAGQITSARNQLTETIIGLMVLLASWLIVDTLLTYFFAEDRVYGRPWETIQCVKLPEYNEVGGGGVSVTPGGGGNDDGPGKICTIPSTGLCSPNNLTIFGGEAINAAKVCFAESGGVANARGTDMLPGNKPFSVGLFQINLTVHVLTGCGGGTLECHTAFDGRNETAVITNENLYEACVAAGETPSCNIKNARRIYDEASGWGPWSTRACTRPI